MRRATGVSWAASAGSGVSGSCPGAKQDRTAATVREQLQKHAFGLAMIGGGVRMLPENTLLFERLVNVLTEEAPWIRLCFNTTPEDTIEALRRWIQA